MEKKKINCYLCDSSAFESDAPDTSRNLFVECQSCKPYYLSTETILFITRRKDGTNILDAQDKRKLIRFIDEEFEKTNKPVLLTQNIIEAVTGKRSVGERY